MGLVESLGGQAIRCGHARRRAGEEGKAQGTKKRWRAVDSCAGYGERDVVADAVDSWREEGGGRLESGWWEVGNN
jgi:hypothetical protein